MKPLSIIVVEDSNEFAAALKKVLEEGIPFPCIVTVLNPSDSTRSRPPTFEEFHDEIRGIADSAPLYLVLMDNSLGWKWKGAHLAPSFENLIAISSDEMRWAEHNFLNKAEIAYRNKDDAKAELLAMVKTALQDSVSPETFAKLYE